MLLKRLKKDFQVYFNCRHSHRGSWCNEQRYNVVATVVVVAVIFYVCSELFAVHCKAFAVGRHDRVLSARDLCTCVSTLCWKQACLFGQTFTGGLSAASVLC